MTTLADVIAGLRDVDDELTIYVVKPWTALSEAVARPDIDGSTAPDAKGFEYFLEVSIALEFIEYYPTNTVDAVIHYAVHDAYL